MPIDDATHGQLLDDLTAEGEQLQSLVAGLSDDDWATATPSAGWDIHDQLVHLAFFDDLARIAVTEPDTFARESADVVAAGSGWVDRISHDRRDLAPAAVLDWWTTSRAAVIATLRAAGPAARAPWFGPPMSAASSATARLMETWAHGQDVADAVGVVRRATDRVAHICHLGVATRGFSHRLRDRPEPTTPLRVELCAPSGRMLQWGPAEAEDRITGPAEDFALVVTQRRHRADTALVATDGPATQWLTIAQVFAGAPGAGRPSTAPSGVGSPEGPPSPDLQDRPSHPPEEIHARP